MTRSESAVRLEVRSGFMAFGWPCCPLHGDEFMGGWPDLLAILPGGRAIFVECKREGEHSRKLQTAIQARLRRAGAVVVSDCTGWAMVLTVLQVEGIAVKWRTY